jgi:hypothetical protein
MTLTTLNICLFRMLRHFGISTLATEIIPKIVTRLWAEARCRRSALPAFKVKGFAGIFIKGRTMVLGIIDIKADVDYILFQRRLHFSQGKWCYPLLRLPSVMIVLDSCESGGVNIF